MKCGSLFSGIGGLDLAVCEFFGAELSWVSEIEKGPCRVLERHFPEVPNLGDITKVDWSEVEPVDILCGGYPCQPFSVAGLKRGFSDNRDLWPQFARAIRVLRPRYVVAENVSGHLQLGFERTLRDLAEMGFDARWGVVRASEAGAPHRRERIFLLATNTEGREDDQAGAIGLLPPASSPDRRSPTESSGSGSGLPQPNAVDEGRRDTDSRSATLVRLRDGAADAEGSRASREPASYADDGRSQQRDSQERGVPEPDAFSWGAYESAIRRWGRVMGPTPHPVDEQRRLSPGFVEWMMGFPKGWVADLSRTQALKALGNAVVPQQARLALELLCA